MKNKITQEPKVVFTCTWHAFEIHANNGTIVLDSEFSNRHDDALEVADVIVRDGDWEEWSGDVVEIDQIHTALQIGDVACCNGYGADVYFVRFDDDE